MPENPREAFAKAFGQARGDSPDPTAEAGSETVVDQEQAEQPTQEPTEEVQADELEQAAEKLKPAEGDSEQVAFDKKEMLKMVNRALRKSADARKAINPGEVEALRQKAAALDLLMKAPDSAQALQQLKGAFGVNSGGQNSDLDVREKELRESFKNDQAFDDFNKFVAWHIEKNLMPKLGPVGAAVSGLIQGKVESDWDKMKAEYGEGIDDWKDAAFKTSREMQIPLRKALLLESEGEIMNMAKEQKGQRAQKKSITTPTQGAGSGAYSRPKPKASTREDRIASFSQGTRKAGVDLPWMRFMKG